MATDDSNRPRYTRQNTFPNPQTPLASPDLESFQLQKQQQHYRHQLTQRPSVPNISSNSPYYTHNARPPPFAMNNSATGTSSPTTDISPSHLLPKKRHTQNEPSLDTPLSFPMPPGFQEEQLRGPSIKGQQSLSSLRHQKESQGLNNVPGTGSAMGASIGLGHAPSRPPRHPSRADSQQQGDVVPGAMNVRIPSSSSSILNNNYNNNHNNNSNNSSFPASPVSMASMSSYTHSYQSQSQTHRRTSASNLRKKSSAGVGGGSRPSTADSATSATANTASGGASGNAYSVVRENVIGEDEGDGDYGEVMYRDRDSYKDRGLGRDRERVEVTPWEFQALPEESVVNEFEQVGRMDTPSTAGTGGVFSQQQQQQQYQAPASRPRSLKSSRASAASGSSSIVPPLPPTPSMSVGTSASATASTFSIPHSVSTSSMRASGAGAVISPSVATGPMDEVTPWDMYPVVESATSNVVSTKANSIPAPVKAPSYTASNTSSINLASPVMSSLASPLNSSSVNLSNLGMAGNTKILNASANVISPSVATGPMDEVTPWDMYPVPEAEPGASVVSGGGASGISGGGMSGMGYVERDRAGSASGSAYSRDRAGSSLGEKEHLKEVKEEKKSKSGAFGKIKAAVKNAAAGGSSSSGNETKARARRGSVSASGGASTKSLATSSSTGNSHTNSHNGATTPTPYIVGFPPQPPPVPPIPPPIIAASAIPSPSFPPPSTVVTPGTPLGKPRSLAQVAEDPVNSHSLSSVGSGSGASSRGTDGGAASSSGVTTPPNTPPMSGLTSPPSLSPTRAYFGHASTNMNGSPKVGAAIYHSPSTSTLGSVLSRRSHQSQVGTNPGASGSAIDLSLSGGQYVHYKSSIPPTPISASTTTSFSHSGISHAHGAYAASTASGSSLGATATGPVEDVTPWEMYPGPTPVPAVPPMPAVPPTPTKEAVRKQRQRAGTAGSVVSALSGRSARSGGAGSNSGSPSIGGGVVPSALQSSGMHAHQGEAVVMGGGASRKSVPYSERSGGAGSGMHSAGGKASMHSGQQQQTTKTGPKEEVTPWELEERLPPAEVAGMIVATTDGLGQQQQTTLSLPLSSSSTLAHQVDPNGGGGAAKAGGIRARGSMTLEQLEEVMPWELSAPPPPSPGLPPPLPPPSMARAGENGHREEGGASMERTGHREKEKDRKSKVVRAVSRVRG
ncbi:hypothetical protein CPC08DRAFT_759399 [Agrocybe pediades]|nr:hypothetical protein CPC08DRAFT_759399 [Agrocybe pediades]